MAPQTPHGEPSSVVAGDSWIWSASYLDYPSSEGWALSYALRGVGLLDTTAGELAVSADEWTVNVPASRTADLAAGTYRWAAYMTGSGSYAGRRHEVGRGVVTVAANATLAAEGTLQSHAERMVETIKAALEGRVTDDVQMTQINGRLITNIPVLELRRMLTTYERQVWREQHPGRIPVTRVVFRGVA